MRQVGGALTWSSLLPEGEDPLLQARRNLAEESQFDAVCSWLLRFASSFPSSILVHLAFEALEKVGMLQAPLSKGLS